MEPRLTLVTLGVNDVARARRFYEAHGFRGVRAKRRERRILLRRGCRAGAVRTRGSRPRRDGRRQPARVFGHRACPQREERGGGGAGAGRGRCRRRAHRQAGQARLLGRVLRLLRRSRRASLGGRAQSGLPARRRGPAAVAEVGAQPHEARQLHRRIHRGHSRRRAHHRHGRGERHQQPSQLLRHEVSARQGLPRDPRQSGPRRPGDPGPAGLRRARRRAWSRRHRRHLPHLPRRRWR